MARLRGAMGALLITMVAGGCSGDPEPRFADPTSASASTAGTPTASASASSSSGTPSATASAEPEVLSPEETVRAWVAARNRLLNSGDPTDVEALSSSICDTCRDLNEGIAETYAAGGSFRTDGWTVNGAKRRPDFKSSRAVATALIFAAGVSRETAEAKPVRYPEERNFLDFTLEAVDGRWLVADVAFRE